MDGVLNVNGDAGHEGLGPMDEFHHELAALLADPITQRVMASDKVEMTSLLALLRDARRRLQNPTRLCSGSQIPPVDPA
jgi:hypothetical protein